MSLNHGTRGSGIAAHPYLRYLAVSAQTFGLGHEPFKRCVAGWLRASPPSSPIQDEGIEGLRSLWATGREGSSQRELGGVGQSICHHRGRDVLERDHPARGRRGEEPTDTSNHQLLRARRARRFAVAHQRKPQPRSTEELPGREEIPS